MTRHVSSRNIVVAGVVVLVVDLAVVVYEIDAAGKNKDFQDVDFDIKVYFDVTLKVREEL